MTAPTRSPSRFAVVGPLSLSALLAACGGGPCPATVPAAQPAVPAPAPAAAPNLDAVDAALLDAQVWRAEVRIAATGRFTADVSARVLATRDNRARIDATGSFDGAPVELHWVSDGARTSTGVDAPSHVTEAIAIGMTRMGLLHNIAMLHGGAPFPDHAEGGVRDWVVAVDPRASGASSLAFGLEVAGHAAGEVTLELATTPHGPVMTRRAIAVHFDEGDMAVEETYRFDLAVELASDSFVVGGGP
jgi:hypothetical protein